MLGKKPEQEQTESSQVSLHLLWILIRQQFKQTPSEVENKGLKGSCSQASYPVLHDDR